MYLSPNKNQDGLAQSIQLSPSQHIEKSQVIYRDHQVHNREQLFHDTEIQQSIMLNNKNKESFLAQNYKASFVAQSNIIGFSQIESNQQYIEAIESFRKTIIQQPDHFQAHFNLAICLDRIGEYEEALAILNRCIIMDPYFYKTYKTIDAILLSKKYSQEDIFEHYEEFVRINPLFSHGIINHLGNKYKEKGQLADAYVSFDRAIDTQPENFDYLVNRMIIYQEQDLKDEFYQDLDKAKSLEYRNDRLIKKIENIQKNFEELDKKIDTMNDSKQSQAQIDDIRSKRNVLFRQNLQDIQDKDRFYGDLKVVYQEQNELLNTFDPEFVKPQSLDSIEDYQEEEKKVRGRRIMKNNDNNNDYFVGFSKVMRSQFLDQKSIQIEGKEIEINEKLSKLIDETANQFVDKQYQCEKYLRFYENHEKIFLEQLEQGCVNISENLKKEKLQQEQQENPEEEEQEEIKLKQDIEFEKEVQNIVENEQETQGVIEGTLCLLYLLKNSENILKKRLALNKSQGGSYQTLGSLHQIGDMEREELKQIMEDFEENEETKRVFKNSLNKKEQRSCQCSIF